MPQKIRRAFTLIEVVFAIMILGIVASIGSEIIVQVYTAYFSQRSVHNASIKTELAINQLANRLTYRIDQSMIARKVHHTGHTYDDDIYPIKEVPKDELDDYPILEWIGYDHDSFSRKARPAWSGYCNTDTSTFATMVTPGSELSAITSPYGNNMAVVFHGYPDYRDDNGSYSATCMYQSDGCIFPVTANGDERLDFTPGTGDRLAGHMVYTEFYQLATTAFAVVPRNYHKINGVHVWDLELYTGYQPWEGDNFTDGFHETLLRNVSVFRFKKETNSIRLKLCVIEQQTQTDQIAICKEKAVIR